MIKFICYIIKILIIQVNFIFNYSYLSNSSLETDGVIFSKAFIKSTYLIVVLSISGYSFNNFSIIYKSIKR